MHKIWTILFLFFNLEYQKLQYKLRNESDNCSCYVAMDQMMQCKHMISFTQGFNSNRICKCWYKQIKLLNQ